MAVTLVLLAPGWIYAPESRAVSSADQVCTPATDPCLITQSITVDSGATLDFGLRSVSVQESGSITFAGGGSIRCGDFAATSSGTALFSRGTVRVEARRVCSGAPERLCFGHGNCQRGPCAPTRCSDTARGQVDCTGDASCSGQCVKSRCSNAPEIGCFVQNNCNFGSCETIRRCSAQSDLLCDNDTTCDFGSCSLGSGNIFFSSRINGNAINPGNLLLAAAGSATLNGSITINSDSSESDGGGLNVTTQNGPVEIQGKVSLVGGGQSTGGELLINSGTDILVTGDIDASGGDFDGGVIELQAVGSITIGSDVTVNSTSGAGYGGEIALLAGQDIILSPGTSANLNTFTADGNADLEKFAGDGGGSSV